MAARLPVVSCIRELDSAPRKFLLFNFFNVISWQCIAGQVLILFARHIDMPPSRVGFLISFMPMSMLLVAFTIPLVTRFGPKRLMFATWMARNLIACSVFLMPWAIAHWGPRAAWYVLMGATLGFCLIRAAGAGGWFPWLHEVVPEDERAAYFSAQATVIQLVNVGVMFGLGLMLRGNPSLNRFLIIYGLGVATGLASLVWMLRVPGGRAVESAGTARGSWASYRLALADRDFVRFVLVAALCFSCVSWIDASLILYMRDALKLPEARIMIFIAVGSAGILLTIRFWGRFAEHSGSGRTMFKTMFGHSVAAFLCLTLLPEAPWTPYGLGIVVTLYFIFRAAFWLAAHRAMLDFVKEAGRVGYTNTYMIGFSLALGLTPIAAGIVIDYGGLWGFRFCFAVSCVLGLCGAVLSRVVVHEGAPLEGSLARLINPAIPLRTLARIAWITAGLHESNRPTSTRD